MNFDEFEVIFKGDIADDIELKVVKERLLSSTKISPSQVKELFSGKSVVLQRNLTKDRAEKWVASFKKIGMNCHILPSKISKCLYLCKSASTGEYLRENLRIIGVSPGHNISIEYRRKWLQSDLLENLPNPKARVKIVLSDPPYDWYIPAREAFLLEKPFIREDKYVFRCCIGNYLNCKNSEVLSNYMHKLSIDNELLPFAFYGPDNLMEQSYEDNHNAWRNLVDCIVGRNFYRCLERYLSSFFFRHLSLVDDKENIIDTTKDLFKVNETYTMVIDCYSPQLSPEKISTLELVGESDPKIIEIDKVHLVQDGKISFKFTPRYGGECEIIIWVNPERLRSTEISLNCTVEGRGLYGSPAETEDEDLNDVDAGKTLSEIEVSQLYNELVGTLDFDNRVHKSSHFRRQIAEAMGTVLVQRSARRFLNEIKGICFFEEKRYEDAFIVLSKVGLKHFRDHEALAAWYISARNLGKTCCSLRDIIQKLNIERISDSTLQSLKSTLPWKQIIINRDKATLADFYSGDLFDKEKVCEELLFTKDGSLVAEWLEWLVDERLYSNQYGYKLLNSWLEKYQDFEKINISKVVDLAVDIGIRSSEGSITRLCRFEPEVH